MWDQITVQEDWIVLSRPWQYVSDFFSFRFIAVACHFSRLFLKVITVLHIITILLAWIFKCYMFAVVKTFRAGFGKLSSKGSEIF